MKDYEYEIVKMYSEIQSLSVGKTATELDFGKYNVGIEITRCHEDYLYYVRTFNPDEDLQIPYAESKELSLLEVKDLLKAVSDGSARIGLTSGSLSGENGKGKPLGEIASGEYNADELYQAVKNSEKIFQSDVIEVKNFGDYGVKLFIAKADDTASMTVSKSNDDGFSHKHIGATGNIPLNSRLHDFLSDLEMGNVRVQHAEIDGYISNSEYGKPLSDVIKGFKEKKAKSDVDMDR